MSAATSSKVLAAAIVAALSGCTLVVQGTSQSVTFTSEPPGATFTVAGQTATTPATLELPKDDYQIQFKRPGYEEASVDLKRKMSNWRKKRPEHRNYPQPTKEFGKAIVMRR